MSVLEVPVAALDPWKKETLIQAIERDPRSLKFTETRNTSTSF